MRCLFYDFKNVHIATVHKNVHKNVHIAGRIATPQLPPRKVPGVFYYGFLFNVMDLAKY